MFLLLAKPGCRIAKFQETYRNLTLMYGSDNVHYNGKITVSCNPEHGWSGDADATCLGDDRWEISGCSSELIMICVLDVKILSIQTLKVRVFFFYITNTN